MVKRVQVAVLFLMLALGSTVTWAQERNGMTSLNNAIRSQWVRFDIAGGRINLQSSAYGPLAPVPGTSNRKDQLTLRNDNGETALLYEWLNAKEEYTLDAGDDGHLKAHFAPKNDPKGTVVEFTQKPQEKSTLILETEGSRRQFAADSVWHLFLLYPEPSRKHLAPLLQPLLPNTKLVESADAIEKELLRNAGNESCFDRSNWERWVAQLGDENFARREAADRALREATPALLIYLQQLDFNRLDAEQQFRIRRIIESISMKISADSPEQVASWLAGDPAIWLTYLTRPEVASRQVAAKQLAAFLEAPIPVDPHADPASQKAEFDKLKTLIESKME